MTNRRETDRRAMEQHIYLGLDSIKLHLQLLGDLFTEQQSPLHVNMLMCNTKN